MRMIRSIFTFYKQASGIDNDLGSYLTPVNFSLIPLGENLKMITIDVNSSVTRGDVGIKVPQNRVVLQQMRESPGIGDVVDGNEVYLAVVHCRTKDVASDSPESVYAYFDRHLPNLRFVARRMRGIRLKSQPTNLQNVYRTSQCLSRNRACRCWFQYAFT